MAQTKREKAQDKVIADLRKQLGQKKPDVEVATEAESAGGGADVNTLRAKLASIQKFLEDYRFNFFDEVPPENVAAKQDEFEKSAYVAEIRNRIAIREKALSDATPTGQRAQQLDREIKVAEAAVKKHEAAAKHSKEVIDNHTVKFNEATSAATAATAEVARLQSLKETFFAEKGLDIKKVDPVFLDPRFALLKDNTEATNMMRRITVMAADAAEAEAKAASSSTAETVPIPVVSAPEVEEMDLDGDVLGHDIGADVAGQAAEALKANPKGSFDWAKAIQATTASRIKAKKDLIKAKGAKK